MIGSFKRKKIREEVGAAEMHLHFITLSFIDKSGQLEREFLKDYYTKYINQVRISLIIAILFYSIFGILDASLMPEMRHQLWFIRYAVFFPLAAIVICWSYFESYKKYMQSTLAFIVILAGVGIVVMIIIAPPPVNYSYYAGLMLIFIFGYSFIRARFVWASAAGWFVVLSYEVGAVVLSDTPLPILINNNFFFISANIIGMFSCYSIEYAARRDFFLARLLGKERQKTQKANQELEQRVKDRTEMLALANKDLKIEIIERKRVEQELREIHSKLEQRVQERTRELKQMHDELENRVEERTLELQQTNEQLVEAKNMADASTRAKSDFLANMSHEIRTPMNAIIGMAELAMNPELQREKRFEYITIINSSARSLLGIINEILDFSKIEAGKFEIEATAFNLHDVISGVSDLFIDEQRKKGIELVVDMAADLPMDLVGDPLRVQQILLNLVSNAFKFTEQGTICIRVACENETEDEVTLKFSVRDSGIGISETVREKLFDAFSQADTSTTRKYGGTGLGLTICHKIVRLMNGAIDFESSPGKGSVFSFVLTLKKGVSSAESMAAVPPEFKGRPVLVVDDNPMTLHVIKQLLVAYGLKPCSASTQEEALTKAKDHLRDPFSLAVVDPDIPVKEALTITEVVHSAMKGVPLVITGSDAFSTPQQKISAELTEVFIQKPVTAVSLYHAVMKALGLESGTESDLDALNMYHFYLSAHVLLVEDNKINQIVATEILTLAGMTVVAADNGVQALDKLKNEAFDIVLMDVQMPEMDGITATKEIRRNRAYRNLPIIAMTAHAIEGDREKCLDAGMDDYVSKPIDRLLLYKKLGRFLPDKVSSRPDAQTNGQTHPKEPLGLIPLIPGVNLSDGMSRMGCDVQRYLTILSQFCNDFEPVIEQIQTSLEQEDTQTAREVNHSLKGAAGNLSIQSILGASEALGKALRQDNPASLNGYVVQIQDAFEQIKSALNQGPFRESGIDQPAVESVHTGDDEDLPNELFSLLSSLDKSLETCNPVEAKMRFDSFLQMASGFPGHTALSHLSDQLASQINTYQFEKARQLIHSFEA